MYCKKISEGKSRRFYYAEDPINQNQLKNQFNFVWFGHTKALHKQKKWHETAFFPTLQLLELVTFITFVLVNDEIYSCDFAWCKFLDISWSLDKNQCWLQKVSALRPLPGKLESLQQNEKFSLLTIIVLVNLKNWKNY